MTKIFRAAGWTVSTAASLNTSRKPQGALALFTGTWPFAAEVTKTCMALTAADLEFSSHIDPEQVREQAILAIGRDIRRTIREGRARRWRTSNSLGERPAAPEEDGFHPAFEEVADWETEMILWKTGQAAKTPKSWVKRIYDAGSAREASGMKRPEPGGVISRGVRLAEAAAAELLTGAPDKKKREWLPLLRELSGVLRELRSGGEALVPAAVARRCTRLAPAMLEQGTGDAWLHALRFADVVFATPPVSDDAEAQNEFEALLARLVRGGDAPAQRAISAEVRSWHWFRTPARRTLHDDLFYRETRSEEVVISAFGRLQDPGPRGARAHPSPGARAG